MNPFLRWVTKIIQIFRPAPPTAKTPAQNPAPKQAATAAPVQLVTKQEMARVVQAKPVHAVAEKSPQKSTQEPVFTGRVEVTPDLDNPARLRQIKDMPTIQEIANR